MLPSVIARIAYGIYVIGLLITQTLLLAAPGGRVPIYAALGVIASIPVLCDKRRLRIWAVPAIVIVMGLIFYDYQAGVRFQQHAESIRRMQAMPSKAPIGPEVGREHGGPAVEIDLRADGHARSPKLFTAALIFPGARFCGNCYSRRYGGAG